MAAPSTIIRAGNGTSVVAYTLPAGLFQYIESVLVEVDNGAGADIRPTLRVKSDAGQVIATKRQGEAIPAGDTGTGTWALRLTDETAATPAATSDLLYDYTLTADQRSIDTAIDGPMAGSLSQEYAALQFVAILRADTALVGTGYNAQLIVNDDVTLAHYVRNDAEWTAAPAGSWAGGGVNNQLWTFRIPASVATAHYYGSCKGTFGGYSDATSRFRQVQYESGDVEVHASATGLLDITFGLWKSSDPIDRLAVRASGALDSLVTDSRLIVVGVGKL